MQPMQRGCDYCTKKGVESAGQNAIEREKTVIGTEAKNPRDLTWSDIGHLAGCDLVCRKESPATKPVEV
jgi:hypothetical protein